MTAAQPDAQGAAISEIHSFAGYSIFMRADHIIEMQFEEGFSGEVEDAQNMISVFRKLNAGIKHGLIVVYKESNMFSREAREYIAQKEITEEVLLADAFVIKGLGLRLLANAYLKFNKPGRPTCLFNAKEEALTWLKKITAV